MLGLVEETHRSAAGDACIGTCSTVGWSRCRRHDDTLVTRRASVFLAEHDPEIRAYSGHPLAVCHLSCDSCVSPHAASAHHSANNPTVSTQRPRTRKPFLLAVKFPVCPCFPLLPISPLPLQGATQAASGLDTELELRLAHLRTAEAKLSDEVEANARLREELRGASGRLRTASAAREALLSFCRQERTAVELEAAEHVSRAEESAGMRGEEGLQRGLELAKMAEEAGDKRVEASNVEVDRLGKALFAVRAELAGSEARAQALRRELGRAAETIAVLSRNAVASGGEGGGETLPVDAGVASTTAVAAEEGTRTGERSDRTGSLLLHKPGKTSFSEPAEGGGGRGGSRGKRAGGTPGAGGASKAAERGRRGVFGAVAAAATSEVDVSGSVERARRAASGRSPRAGARQAGYDVEL